MDAKKNNAENVDDYISQFPKDVQTRLKKIRAVVRKLVPQATEKISYGIPTFTFHGNLVHFGGYEEHIGFYPGSDPIKVFEKDLAKYETSKGTVRFPLDKPLPITLITKIVKYCVKARLAKLKK